MLKRLQSSTFLIMGILLLGGCSLNDDLYSYEHQNGDLFEMRIRVDEVNQNVIIIQKHIPKDKTKVAFFVQDFSISKSNGSCAIVSQRNWYCQSFKYDPSSRFALIDGNLFHQFGGEWRAYRRLGKFSW